jgi:hypothetical protein
MRRQNDRKFVNFANTAAKGLSTFEAHRLPLAYPAAADTQTGGLTKQQ